MRPHPEGSSEGCIVFHVDSRLAGMVPLNEGLLKVGQIRALRAGGVNSPKDPSSLHLRVLCTHSCLMLNVLTMWTNLFLLPKVNCCIGKKDPFSFSRPLRIMRAKIVSGKHFVFIISLTTRGDLIWFLLSLSYFPHFCRGGHGDSERLTDSAVVTQPASGRGSLAVAKCLRAWFLNYVSPPFI